MLNTPWQISCNVRVIVCKSYWLTVCAATRQYAISMNVWKRIRSVQSRPHCGRRAADALRPTQRCRRIAADARQTRGRRIAAAACGRRIVVHSACGRFSAGDDQSSLQSLLYCDSLPFRQRVRLEFPIMYGISTFHYRNACGRRIEWSLRSLAKSAACGRRRPTCGRRCGRRAADARQTCGRRAADATQPTMNAIMHFQSYHKCGRRAADARPTLRPTLNRPLNCCSEFTNWLSVMRHSHHYPVEQNFEFSKQLFSSQIWFIIKIYLVILKVFLSTELVYGINITSKISRA